MVDDMIRQRIKYLIEHGELYPTDKPLGEPKGVKLLVWLIGLTVVQILIAVADMLTHMG